MPHSHPLGHLYRIRNQFFKTGRLQYFQTGIRIIPVSYTHLDVYKRQVIGGMVFSTIITMIIVPAVYAAMDKSGSRDKKKALAKEFKFMKDFDPEKDLPKK